MDISPAGEPPGSFSRPPRVHPPVGATMFLMTATPENLRPLEPVPPFPGPPDLSALDQAIMLIPGHVEEELLS